MKHLSYLNQQTSFQSTVKTKFELGLEDKAKSFLQVPLSNP